MNTAKIIIPAITFLVLRTVTSLAQDSIRAVILHKDVGTMIDKYEGAQYRLFTAISEFHEGVFFQVSDEDYLAIVTLIDKSGAFRDSTIPYSEGYLLTKAEQIAHFEAFVRGEYTIGTEPTTELMTVGMRDTDEYNPGWAAIIQSALIPHTNASEDGSQRLQTDTIRIHAAVAKLEHESEHLVQIVGASGKSVEGTLLAVREDAIVLEAVWPFGVDPDTISIDKNPLGKAFSVFDKDVFLISKDRILRAKVIGDSHFGRNFGLGLAGGTLGGVLIGTAVSAGPSGSRDMEGIEITVGLILGFLGGVVVGVVAGVASIEGDIELNPMTDTNYIILRRYTRYPDQEPPEYHIVQ